MLARRSQATAQIADADQPDTTPAHRRATAASHHGVGGELAGQQASLVVNRGAQDRADGGSMLETHREQ